MKVLSLKNIEIKDCCPACDSISNFERYINAIQCNNHSNVDVCFFFDKERKIYKVEFIEDRSSIIFDFVKDNLVLLTPNESEVYLPMFDMDIDSVNVSAIKKIMVFT